MSVGPAKLREDSDRIRKGAIAKGEDPALIDQALVIDEQRRNILGKADNLRAQRKQ
ncbi:MAG: serine--tRNA ligase, partial [Chloroflexota bacterium]